MSTKNLFRGVFMAGVLLYSSALFAQEQGPPPPQQQMQQQMPRKTPEQKAEGQIRWMRKNLMITDEQSKKVYNIILNGAREEENANVNGPQKGEKKAIKRDEKDELKAVLNPDQFQRYMAHLKEIKEKAMERKAGGPY